eukprot:NODE_2834_length_635_cov_130.602389_g2358_i0.p1 GENE.NODE_2834_length_635_cov_130.602389_g2358_i0~~NODE_2834_length_635_cov_130.602389_g2358_i0.p1  ORF type:complete len:88 (-),score=0.49 NODE_2834_length_635_cov_130.602389_g2358_i0:173-436(-)
MGLLHFATYTLWVVVFVHVCMLKNDIMFTGGCMKCYHMYCTTLTTTSPLHRPRIYNSTAVSQRYERRRHGDCTNHLIASTCMHVTSY